MLPKRPNAPRPRRERRPRHRTAVLGVLLPVALLLAPALLAQPPALPTGAGDAREAPEGDGPPPGPPQRDGDAFRWSVGLGVVASPSPYRGVDEEIFPVPALQVEWGRFFFRGIAAGWEAVEGDTWELDLVARARFGGYEAADSPFLAGMEKRGNSLDVGLEGRWTGGRLGSQPVHVEASALTDALDESGGQELTALVVFPRRLGPSGRLMLEPGIGAVWWSEAFADHYFGVRPDEARPGRPAHRVGAALAPRLELGLLWRLGRHWTLVGSVDADLLPDEITDSPIVTDDVAWGGFAALSWSP